MKKILSILFLLLIPLVSASSINVKLLSLNPSPVITGTLFSVTFEAVNTNNEAIKNVRFELNVPSSFNIEDDEEIEFDELSAGEKVILSWLVEVKKDASAGFEKLELIVDEAGKDINYFFPVQVKSFEPTLTIKKVETNPSQTPPGSDVFVTLSLTNQASFSLKNIKVKLDLKNTPFAPKQGIEEQTIKTLIESEQLNFQLTALPEATAGVYKIPVILNYFDEFGNPYTNTNLISIKVGSTPRLEVNQESPFLILNKKQEATIKIVNNGLTKIKLLTVNIQPVNAELLSSNNIYIGDLDVDDFQTITVELYPKTENTQLSLTFNFKDANNKEFKETVVLPLKIYSFEKAKKLGLIKRNNLPIYLAIITILLVSYIFYKKIRKK